MLAISRKCPGALIANRVTAPSRPHSRGPVRQHQWLSPTFRRDKPFAPAVTSLLRAGFFLVRSGDSGFALEEHERRIRGRIKPCTLRVCMSPLVAAPMGGGDVVSTIGAAIASGREVLGGRTPTKPLAAVDAQAALGESGGRTMFLESARHGDLERLNFESPVRLASERAPVRCAIPAVWGVAPRTVGQPCPSVASICPLRTAAARPAGRAALAAEVPPPSAAWPAAATAPPQSPACPSTA